MIVAITPWPLLRLIQQACQPGPVSGHCTCSSVFGAEHAFGR